MSEASPVQTVDLNSDMGEAFGLYRMGEDEAILEVVSSANVACGFHGGDPEVMAKTFGDARKKNITVGAHPGFNDLWGFGRRVVPHTIGEIERMVAYQIGAAQALSAYAGNPIKYVKPHGALGNLCEVEMDVAVAVTNAVKAVDPKLICLSIADGCQDHAAREMGMAVASEIYADRAYDDEGRIVSRKLPGAVIHDPEFAAARVVRMVKAGAIETVSGKLIPRVIDSICLHGDNPSAVALGTRVRRELEKAGVSIRSFA